MEFAQRLRALRAARGVSQSELARAISVSRSAVAKWENGLGLPGEASYELLLRYFGVLAEELPLDAPQSEQIGRKRRLKGVFLNVIAVLLVAASLALPILLLHLHDRGYGFTSALAVGEIWADNAVIRTDDYDFYYNTFNSETEGGEAIMLWSVTQKLPIGYRRISASQVVREVFYADGKQAGRLFTYEGKYKDYHIYSIAVGVHHPSEGVPPYTLCIGDKEYEMLVNSFFETDHGKQIGELKLNGIALYVQ